MDEDFRGRAARVGSWRRDVLGLSSGSAHGKSERSDVAFFPPEPKKGTRGGREGGTRRPEPTIDGDRYGHFLRGSPRELGGCDEMSKPDVLLPLWPTARSQGHLGSCPFARYAQVRKFVRVSNRLEITSLQTTTTWYRFTSPPQVGEMTLLPCSRVGSRYHLEPGSLGMIRYHILA